MISVEKKASAEKEKKQVEDIRAKALERVGETRKRVVGDEVSEEPEKKEKRTRRCGAETIVYLREKSEKEFKIRQEELELRKKEVCPSKAARGNDTATDPSTGAAANNVC